MQKRFDRGNAEEAGRTTPAQGWRRNLMRAIDRWVVRETFDSLCPEHSDKPINGDCVHTVNLSGTTISDDGFSAYLREQLGRHKTFVAEWPTLNGETRDATWTLPPSTASVIAVMGDRCHESNR